MWHIKLYRLVRYSPADKHLHIIFGVLKKRRKLKHLTNAATSVKEITLNCNLSSRKKHLYCFKSFIHPSICHIPLEPASICSVCVDKTSEAGEIWQRLSTERSFFGSERVKSSRR